jgi:hypothetical protein
MNKTQMLLANFVEALNKTFKGQILVPYLSEEKA